MMHARFVAIAGLAFFLPAAAILHGTADADEAHALDVKTSRATFGIDHVLIERVTGNVPIRAGWVKLAADATTPIAAEATLDARHITTGDGDRDGDLQGPDWFETATFPQWIFRSTHVTTTGAGSYDIAGLLTIHGVSVPVTLTTTLVRAGPHPLYHATTTIDRHAFGMTVTRVDVMVGSLVTIVLDVALS